VPATTARKLCLVGRPAAYGRKDKTLRDPRVRDTWEIPSRLISIDQRQWNQTLLPELARIREQLGLGDNATLTAELHNMLVYEPGQFFAAHQDSEKTDRMVGTLVVVLPSTFKGGALEVEHHGERIIYRGSRDLLTLIAFYADCHHQVRPVTDGYRVALTYNLVLREGSKPSLRAAGSTDVRFLRDAVQSHFNTAPPQMYPRQPPPQPPDRLVYLLDHHYTQKGLAWDVLKNGDAARASALREVARHLGCELFLALADVHESWSCEDEWDGGGYGRGWGRDEAEDVDEEESSPQENAHTLVDLIDSDVELRHWVDSSGKQAETISSRVHSGEVCYTKASSELEPFRSEHEGYMGNYGNTVDRWYHRAAVVLWPRDRTFVIRAKASASWAIEQVSAELKARKQDSARELAARLSPFWKGVVPEEPTGRFIRTLLQVAEGLGSPELAASLLDPLALDQLSPSTGGLCHALLKRYGPQWCAERFTVWGKHEGHERDAWIESMAAFCKALSPTGTSDELELVRHLVKAQLNRVAEEYKALCKRLPGRYPLEGLQRLQAPIMGLLESSTLAQSPEIHEQVLDLLSFERVLLPWTVGVLRLAVKRHGPNAMSQLGLGGLADQCAASLGALLAAPPRSEVDWSIASPKTCNCQLCKTLETFLVDGGRIRMEWPLAKERRAHIHQVLDGHDLPVRHETLRQGSPYVLILSKTRALFEEDAAERHAWERDLEWLRAGRGTAPNTKAERKSSRTRASMTRLTAGKP
jgi:hypothetical protein